jgi:hypothetical protein
MTRQPSRKLISQFFIGRLQISARTKSKAARRGGRVCPPDPTSHWLSLTLLLSTSWLPLFHSRLSFIGICGSAIALLPGHNSCNMTQARPLPHPYKIRIFLQYLFTIGGLTCSIRPSPRHAVTYMGEDQRFPPAVCAAKSRDEFDALVGAHVSDLIPHDFPIFWSCPDFVDMLPFGREG